MTLFEKHMINMYGDIGKIWLKNLPKRINYLTQIWNLSNLEPVPNLSFNYVMMGNHNSLPIVLKLTLSEEELSREIAAMQVFNGYGMVPLVACEKGAVLIERARPGTPLREYFPSQESASVSIFCNIITALHHASSDLNRLAPYLPLFTPLKEVTAVLDQNWDIPEEYLTKARKLKEHLLATTTEEVLLHGDLHHDNIIQHGNSFVAIDPKGFIGDRLYDVAPFIRNPMIQLVQLPDAFSLLTTRIEMISLMLKADTERVTQWVYVQSLLTWIWSLQDGTDTKAIKHMTALMNQLV